jgi:hypothetical protein
LDLTKAHAAATSELEWGVAVRPRPRIPTIIWSSSVPSLEVPHRDRTVRSETLTPRTRQPFTMDAGPQLQVSAWYRTD